MIERNLFSENLITWLARFRCDRSQLATRTEINFSRKLNLEVKLQFKSHKMCLYWYQNSHPIHYKQTQNYSRSCFFIIIVVVERKKGSNNPFSAFDIQFNPNFHSQNYFLRACECTRALWVEEKKKKTLHSPFIYIIPKHAVSRDVSMSLVIWKILLGVKLVYKG